MAQPPGMTPPPSDSFNPQAIAPGPPTRVNKDVLFPGQAPPAPKGEQIVLDPKKTSPAPKPPKQDAVKKIVHQPEVKDGAREIVETVVFVVVLVLLLKTFLAEAFVIPTGSMATTLLGYHKKLVCEECGYDFLVNCSSEVEPQNGQYKRVLGAYCPNCRQYHDLTLPPHRRN